MTKRPYQYTIISGFDEDHVAAQVTSLLKEGNWEPCGGLQVSADGRFSQALIWWEEA